MLIETNCIGISELSNCGQLKACEISVEFINIVLGLIFNTLRLCSYVFCKHTFIFEECYDKHTFILKSVMTNRPRIKGNINTRVSNGNFLCFLHSHVL